MEGLASHCHERFYTLGVDGDGRRRWMDRRGEWENGSRMTVSLI